MADDDRELIKRFVAAFEVLDDLTLSDRAVAEEERIGDLTPLLRPPVDPGEWPEWRPVGADLPASALAEFYRTIPGPLPVLYEELILSHYFAEVDLGRLRLLAHLPPGLRSLAGEMMKDSILFDTLAPAGFVQFGKGTDYDYDPVCFDLNTRDTSDDCRIVKFDHEEIFSKGQVGRFRVLAVSFRRLVESVIDDAILKSTRGSLRP